jgi:hypothetical protein
MSAVSDLKLVAADLAEAVAQFDQSNHMTGEELLRETLPKLCRVIAELEAGVCPACGGTGGFHNWRNCSGVAPPT